MNPNDCGEPIIGTCVQDPAETQGRDTSWNPSANDAEPSSAPADAATTTTVPSGVVTEVGTAVPATELAATGGYWSSDGGIVSSALILIGVVLYVWGKVGKG